jgi:hypothetical protein
MLEIGPADTLRVDGRSGTNVVDENTGEVQTHTSLDVTITREREHARGTAAASAVVPKSGS